MFLKSFNICAIFIETFETSYFEVIGVAEFLFAAGVMVEFTFEYCEVAAEFTLTFAYAGVRVVFIGLLFLG